MTMIALEIAAISIRDFQKNKEIRGYVPNAFSLDDTNAFKTMR
jgi:hypothetical protein